MSMKRYFNIDVPRRHNICAKGEEVLQPGADYFSVITESDENCFSRADYCSDCWKHIDESSKIQEAVTYWKAKVPQKEEVKELYSSKNESAMALLKEFAGSGDDEERQQAFILALFLARQREIIQRKELKRDDGCEVLIYEVAETEEMIAVDKFSLSSLQIQKVQKALAEKMKGLCKV